MASQRLLLCIRLFSASFRGSSGLSCSPPSLFKNGQHAREIHTFYADCLDPGLQTPNLAKTLSFFRQKLASGLQNSSRLTLFYDVNNDPPRHPTSSRSCKGSKRATERRQEEIETAQARFQNEKLENVSSVFACFGCGTKRRILRGCFDVWSITRVCNVQK